MRVSRLVLLAAVVVFAFFAVGGTAVFADVATVPERAKDALRSDDDGGQSRSQISPSEFLEVERGASTSRVRGLLGAPEETSKATVEGLDVECWLYGIAGGNGAFQLCFADGKLSSRFRFG